MLLQLTIKNFALIEDIRIDFDKGLNVLTGETGAGKSILLDGLRAALGERLSASVLRDKGKACLIEAVFSIPGAIREESSAWNEFLSEDDDYLVLKREVSSDGKTKNYLNRQLVNLSVLRDLGRRLVDFHGQYDQQAIFDTQTHLALVDRLAGLYRSGPKREIFEAYEALYEKYKNLSERREALREASEDKARQTDLLRYQIEEIEKVTPEEGEEEELQTERIRLAHSQKLYDITQSILMLLDEDESSASARLSDASRSFQQWIKIDESAGEMLKEFEEAQIKIEELLRSVREYQSELSFEEDGLSEIQDRLDAIEMLKRKYGGSVTAVNKFLAEAKQRYDDLINSELYQTDMEKEIGRLLPEMEKAAQSVTKLRREASRKLSGDVLQELKSLGIAKAEFEVRLIETDWGPHGREKAEFFLNPNPGQELKPLAKIASGGEASRILLALKRALAKVDETPTLIFDEIDANIGGRLGEIVGRKLREISAERQILLITHLPQIASFANRHYKVSKAVTKSETRVAYTLLEGDEVVKELAQMMSGARETDISRSHAEEMLKTASR